MIKEGKIKIKIKNIIAKTIITKEITIMIIGEIITNITKVIMIEEINREMLEEIITRMREEAIMMRNIQRILDMMKDIQGIIEMIRDTVIIRMSREMRIIKTEDIRMIIRIQEKFILEKIIIIKNKIDMNIVVIKIIIIIRITLTINIIINLTDYFYYCK